MNSEIGDPTSFKIFFYPGSGYVIRMSKEGSEEDGDYEGGQQSGSGSDDDGSDDNEVVDIMHKVNDI
jgi:hypothetical protein